MIDLIIPVYNETESHMLRLLASVAVQDLYKDIVITIVDDCSTDEKEYLKAVERFNGLLNINVISTPENCGPGGARQYGIDNTKEEFITFADSDDEFWGTNSFSCLLKNMINDKDLPRSMCIGNFYEEVIYSVTEVKPEQFIPHTGNLVWMFAKMYRREFIDKYQIRFLENARSNEDMGFNRLVSMYSKEDEYPIGKFDLPIYLWKFNPNSITRNNNKVYAHSGDPNGSYAGFIKNRTHVIRHAMQHEPSNPQILTEIAETFFYAASVYIEDEIDYAEYRDEKYKYLKDFYIEFIQPIKDTLTIKNKISDIKRIDELRRKYTKAKTLSYSPISLFEVLENSTKD